MSDLQVFKMWEFHLRSLVIVTPRYLAESTVTTGVPLIDADTCGFTWLLEITRSELFDGLMESPDDIIQLEMRSMSCWKMVESQPLVRGLYSSIPST